MEFRARLSAALQRAAHRIAGRHVYLSTGCLHGDHGYCQGMTGLNGAKRPGECKHCQAKCVCDCHARPPRTFAEGTQQLIDELDRRKEQP